MKIAIICVGVTLRFRTVPPHGSSNKTRVNRAMPHHDINAVSSNDPAAPQALIPIISNSYLPSRPTSRPQGWTGWFIARIVTF